MSKSVWMSKIIKTLLYIIYPYAWLEIKERTRVNECKDNCRDSKQWNQHICYMYKQTMFSSICTSNCYGSEIIICDDQKTKHYKEFIHVFFKSYCTLQNQIRAIWMIKDKFEKRNNNDNKCHVVKNIKHLKLQIWGQKVHLSFLFCKHIHETWQ